MLRSGSLIATYIDGVSIKILCCARDVKSGWIFEFIHLVVSFNPNALFDGYLEINGSTHLLFSISVPFHCSSIQLSRIEMDNLNGY